MNTGEIKILLTSDIHLGINESETHIPPKARINTFKRIMNLAAEHNILIIAGDLIESVAIDPEILAVIQAEFARLRELNVEILLTPGPGELNDDNTIPSFLFDLLPSFIFSSPEITTPWHFTKDEQHLYFYGIPSSYSQDIASIRKATTEGFHIGLFHVEFNIENKDSKESVFTLHKKSLKKLELDFYALGNNHNFKMFKVADRIIGTYPGSPEATSFNETGDRYVISISLKNNEIYQIKRLSVNSVRLCDNEIDCSELNSLNRIFNLLDENRNKNTIQRLTFTGERDFIINPESINKFRDMYLDIIINDLSSPSLKSLINEHASGNSIRNEFFKALKKDINNDKVPKDVDMATLAMFLHIATTRGFKDLEEWLCR